MPVLVVYCRYIEDNPGLQVPEPLKQLQALAARDYKAAAATSAPAGAPPPAAQAAPAGTPSSSAQPPPRASFDQQPLRPVALPDLSGLNLNLGPQAVAGVVGGVAAGGPPALRISPMGGGPPPLRPMMVGSGAGRASAGAGAAAAPAGGHHHEFLSDPARIAEQQDK